jgi:hypothetical protein
VSQEQEPKKVHWQEVQRLANRLRSLDSHFTRTDKRTLELVFDAAHDKLVGGKPLRALPTDALYRPVPEDELFDKGDNAHQTLTAFKVSELYERRLAEDRNDEKPPDDEPRGE